LKAGTSHTEQSRKLISEKMKGRPKSESTKERMALARTVWWATERQRRKQIRIGKERQAAIDDLTQPLE